MSDVETVHLVAKTHLDVGFTARAADVVDTYVSSYIPRALALAASLRERGGAERFVWTTGSWLVDTFLERTDAAGRRAAEEAIAAGDLAWHALPFTTHTELCDIGLIEAGLEIAARLDHRFGRRTIAAKLTDVPGHTRGLVPLLASAGVEMLHVGVNPVATVPDVPPVFRWRSPDGAAITVVYQAGGYGDLTVVPGAADALAFAHTGDNLGPPSVDDVIASFAALAERVPGATVVGSTLDAFAVGLRAVADDLPVVTSEIGDTWIHGVGSDPRKVARYRELLRLRRSWAAEGMVAPDDSRLRGFHEHLLLVAEHTWGLDEKTHLPDRVRWGRSTLAELRSTPEAQAFEASWDEQRAYVDAAVLAIDSEPLRRAASSTLRVFDDPLPPRVAGAELDIGALHRVGDWEVGVSEAGAIIHLVDTVTGHVLADAAHPVALVAHEAFSEADYGDRWDTYVRSRPEDEWWAVEDNLKPGIDAAGAVSAWWEPEDVAVHEGERLSGQPDPSALVVVVELPTTATTTSGAPARIEIHLTDASPAAGPARLGIEVRWDDKPANRLPEATWLGVRPIVADPEAMLLDKLGQDVSPLDVVPGGNRHLHAVGEGVRWPGPDGVVALRTFDAPLVALAAADSPERRPQLLRFTRDQPDLAAGVWVCLHDNLWGTNFPMWSEGRARFRLELEWAPA